MADSAGKQINVPSCIVNRANISKLQFAHDFVEGVTSHIIHKQAPKWNPSRLEDLDLDEDIRVRFFHANVARRLNFMNTQDCYRLPYEKYALPSEKEIFEVRSKHNLSTVRDTVAWFEEDRKDKYGVREKVEDVLNRYEM